MKYTLRNEQNALNQKGALSLTKHLLPAGFFYLMLLFGVFANAQTSQTFTSNGSFVVPVGVTTVQVEAWGGGGGGAGTAATFSGNRAGGGGAGGTYTKNTNVTVNSGSTVTVTVGAGGAGGIGAAGTTGGTSTFASPTPVNAVGGNGGALGTTGAGGAATTGITFNGGAGGSATASVSGGGGGGAGATGSGGAASGATAGTGGTGGGGIGAAGLTGTGTGNSATALSGGGGGSRTTGASIGSIGGAGFRGQVIVTYTCPNYTLTSPTTATGPFCGASTSVVTIRSASMLSGSYTIKYNLSGATTATSSTATVSFTAGNPGTGTFTTSSLNPGTTTISIISIANGACTSTLSDNNTATVNVIPLPTASAGTAVSTCAGSGAVNITSGATTTNSTGVLWTSSGNGTFTNADSLTLAEYTPGNSDIAAGSVTITLTATGISPCTTASSNKTLTVLPVPVTTGVSICIGEAGVLSSSTICTNTAPISSGIKLAGSGVSVAGIGTAWTNPGNITSDNNANATVAVSSTSTGTVTSTSRALFASNFGFTIPSNATIVGIQAGIGRFASQNVLGNIKDNTVTLVKAAAAVGNNKAATGTNWPTAEALAAYGSTTDLWGTTWTPAEINANNFGVALIVNLSASLFTTTTASIDYIQLTVTYTVPGTLNWYTASSGGTAIGSGLTFNPVGVPNSGLADTNTPGTTVFYAECATVPGCRTATNFTINPLPTVSFTAMANVYCENAATVGLTANHSGGTFSGAGITNIGTGTANFSPSVAGVGPHTIQYSFTDTNGCSNSTSQIVNVNANVNYYSDSDGDTYGNANNISVSCTGAPAGYVLNQTDCDDSNQLLFNTYPFYVDSDSDNYGAGSLVNACALSATQPPLHYSLVNGDCDDTTSTTHPGAVEIGYDVVDNDCDGLTDEGFPPKQTTLMSAMCGIMLTEINTPIYANLVAGAQGYRWKITTMIGGNTPGEVQYLDSVLRTMKITQLAHYAFNTTYQVEVAVYYSGHLQPFLQSTCQVTTPATTTQLMNCGTSVTNMNDIIYANNIPFATGYRFRISDPGNILNSQEIERNVREFKMNLVNSFVVQYGKTYNVECAIRNTDGGYLPYGSICTVATPLFPTTSIQESQCDNGLGSPYIAPDYNTLIYASSFPGAVSYAFKLVGPGLPSAGAVVIKSLRAFKLSDFSGMGLIPGASYNASVRLIFNVNDPEGPYGKVCTLTVPGLSKVNQNSQAISEWSVTAHPNPFIDGFSLSFNSQIKGNVTIKVYDMAGRLLDSLSATPSQIPSIKIGELYPSGIYTITIHQGNETKTLRMIKR